MVRPSPRSAWGLFLLSLLLCSSMTGCGGPSPLKFSTNPAIVGPWCAANQRVRIGMRVVGKVAWGEDKWKDFLVDDAGKEYDPEKLADQVWSYCEGTGDAKKIKDAYSRDGSSPRMTVVSLKPTIVILETKQDAASSKQGKTSQERYHWLARIRAMGEPAYQEGLQWFSPDLKQRPTPLTFSKGGVAEIAFKQGKLTLTRNGDACKTARE
jgi:hypothetical protein